jgi:hypothetical protein
MDQELTKLNEIARKDGEKFAKKRFPYATIEKFIKDRVFLGLIGPRGVGKTVLLKQLLVSSKTSFYISLDSTRLQDGLFNLASELSKSGIKLLLIDEIHMLPGFERDLKKIFDFLDLQIVFTSSCALSLYNSTYDLSRRVRTVPIPPFSFREYIWFKKNEKVPAFRFKELFNLSKSKEYYGSCLRFEALFNEYLKGGSYPFAIDQDEPLALFKNVLTTVLSKDIFYADKISAPEQMEIERMLRFIGNAPAEDISYSAIAGGVGITKYKAERYVSVLEKAFILRRVFPKGANVLKEPKVMFMPPYRLLYRSFEDCMGALREDFFIESTLSAGLELFYLKTKRGEKTPDYLVGDSVFEIGGKNKGREQFKGVSYKRKIILTQPGSMDEARRPLFFFGMF